MGDKELKYTSHKHINILITKYKEEEHPIVKRSRLIDLCEVVIKTQVAIIVGHYLKYQEPSDEIKGYLAITLQKPSLGTWQGIGRKLLKEYITRKEIDKQSYNVTKDINKVDKFMKDFFEDFNRVNNSIDSLIKHRNSFAHGSTPSVKQAEKDILELWPNVERILESTWLIESKIEVIKEGELKKPYLIKDKGEIIELYPIVQYIEYKSYIDDKSIWFLNDLSTYAKRKVKILHYPTATHHIEEMYYDYLEQRLPINEWKKLATDEFKEKIYYLSNGFKGRICELEQIEAFIKEHEKGCVMIYGNPGVGKTSLMAKIIAQYKYDKDLSDQYEVIDFFAKNNSGYTSGFSYYYYLQRIIGKYSKGKYKEDNEDEIKHIILYQLKQRSEKIGKKKLILIVDGLDEAEESLLKVLPTEYLPNIIYIYAGRPTERLRDYMSYFAYFPLLKLKIEGLDRNDVRGILIESVNKYLLKDEQVNYVWKMTEGNPLYLNELCNYIQEQGIQTLDSVELPKSLEACYDLKMRELYKKNEQTGCDILYMLACAKDYLDTDMLEDLLDIKESEVNQGIASVYEFLVIIHMEGKELYQLFHETFREYLLKLKSDKIIEMEQKITDTCEKWKVVHNSNQRCLLRKYIAKYYIKHLANQKKIEKIYELVIDDEFVEFQTVVLGHFQNVLTTCDEIIRYLVNAGDLNRIACIMNSKEKMLSKPIYDIVLNNIENIDQEKLTGILQLIDKLTYNKKVLMCMLLLYEVLENECSTKLSVRIVEYLKEYVMYQDGDKSLLNSVPIHVVASILKKTTDSVIISCIGEMLQPENYFGEKEFFSVIELDETLKSALEKIGLSEYIVKNYIINRKYEEAVYYYKSYFYAYFHEGDIMLEWQLRYELLFISMLVEYEDDLIIKYWCRQLRLDEEETTSVHYMDESGKRIDTKERKIWLINNKLMLLLCAEEVGREKLALEILDEMECDEDEKEQLRKSIIIKSSEYKAKKAKEAKLEDILECMENKEVEVDFIKKKLGEASRGEIRNWKKVYKMIIEEVNSSSDIIELLGILSKLLIDYDMLREGKFVEEKMVQYIHDYEYIGTAVKALNTWNEEQCMSRLHSYIRPIIDSVDSGTIKISAVGSCEVFNTYIKERNDEEIKEFLDDIGEGEGIEGNRGLSAYQAKAEIIFNYAVGLIEENNLDRAYDYFQQGIEYLNKKNKHDLEWWLGHWGISCALKKMLIAFARQGTWNTWEQYSHVVKYLSEGEELDLIYEIKDNVSVEIEYLIYKFDDMCKDNFWRDSYIERIVLYAIQKGKYTRVKERYEMDMIKSKYERRIGGEKRIELVGIALFSVGMIQDFINLIIEDVKSSIRYKNSYVNFMFDRVSLLICKKEIINLGKNNSQQLCIMATELIKLVKKDMNHKVALYIDLAEIAIQSQCVELSTLLISNLNNFLERQIYQIYLEGIMRLYKDTYMKKIMCRDQYRVLNINRYSDMIQQLSYLIEIDQKDLNGGARVVLYSYRIYAQHRMNKIKETLYKMSEKKAIIYLERMRFIIDKFLTTVQMHDLDGILEVTYAKVLNNKEGFTLYGIREEWEECLNQIEKSIVYSTEWREREQQVSIKWYEIGNRLKAVETWKEMIRQEEYIEKEIRIKIAEKCILEKEYELSALYDIKTFNNWANQCSIDCTDSIWKDTKSIYKFYQSVVNQLSEGRDTVVGYLYETLAHRDELYGKLDYFLSFLEYNFKKYHRYNELLGEYVVLRMVVWGDMEEVLFKTAEIASIDSENILYWTNTFRYYTKYPQYLTYKF